jgi:diguanylate cyclase (GGDEF)-like protein
MVRRGNKLPGPSGGLMEINEKQDINFEDQIISGLGEDVTNEKILLERLKEALRGRPETQIYQYLFFVLAHLRLNPSESKYFWNDITRHRREMQKTLGRDVGFRVAMLDYFINVNQRIKNPLVIEISIYMQTLKTTLIDNLTGLYNTRYMEEAFKVEIKRSLRYKQKFSVLFLDIDGFKIYNDMFGHLSGDIALKEISLGIKNALRAEDVICRYGGEEFVAILPYTDKRCGIVVAEKIRMNIEQMVFGEEGSRMLTISGGLSSFPADGKTMRELLNAADSALYTAKRSGKNQIVTRPARSARFALPAPAKKKKKKKS